MLSADRIAMLPVQLLRAFATNCSINTPELGLAPNGGHSCKSKRFLNAISQMEWSKLSKYIYYMGWLKFDVLAKS